MKITIDSDILTKEGISMQEFSVILYYLCGNNDILNNELCESLWNRNILQKTTEGYILAPHMVPIIESWVAYSSIPKINKRDLEKLADSLRELYPSGKKEGTNYYWRDSTKTIANRLSVFIKKYGNNYSDEDIIKATEKYIKSFNGNYHYMQLLKYFIYKDDNSQLLSYIENEDSENISDWTTRLI